MITTVRFAVAVMMCAALSSVAHGQNYPEKPIRLVVPFAAGGTTDFVARYLGNKLAEQSGQSFVVDNRGGAGGTIGADITAKAPGDGYTLMMYHLALTTAPSLYKKLPYDTLRDIAPVAIIGTTPSIMVVHPSVKAETVKDVIALARTPGAPLNYGSAGIGSAGHLACALFEFHAGVKMTHIPYKGGGPALAAMVGGELQVMIQVMPDTIRHVRSGRLKLIAVSTAKRLAEIPTTPTIAESGVPNYEFYTWFGMFAPGTTPKAIQQTLNGMVNKVITQPAVQTELRKDGMEAQPGTVEDFRALVASDVDKWAKVIKAAGVQPN